ncbi:MAG: GGDEF domain-containing protein [Eubacterium sp.]|nr:GGDEF domain-containing protein [Eubacterium sp.]
MVKIMTAIYKNRFIYKFHICLYVAMLIFIIACLAVSLETHGSTMEVWEFFLAIGLFLVMVVVEHVVLRDPEKVQKHPKVGYTYHLIRIIVATVAYYYWVGQPIALAFFALIILFSIETFTFVAYDDTGKRIQYYLSYAVCYIVPSMGVRMVTHNLPSGLSGFLREIGLTMVMVVIPVIIGESLARIYDEFFKQIMAQQRSLESLNNVNEELKEHQDRIKKVNDVLGTQKIQLQTANKKINRSHDEMSVQNEVSSAIASSMEKEPLMRKIVDILQIRLDMDAVIIILEPDNTIQIPGQEPKGRFLAIATNMGDAFAEQIKRSVFETDLKEMLVMSKLYMQNTSTESVKFFQFLEDRFDMPSVICLPIIGKREARYGTLIVMKNKINAFMDGAAFYQNIAGQISLGVSNAMLYEQMNDMAIRDGLTRIYNRGHLNKLMNQYLSEAMQKKIPVSLALFDIDKFKLVNDNYGHQCGDEAIKHVSRLLNIAALKNGGIAGRYGGEEFVIAFLGKGVRDVYAIADQVHKQIRETPISFADRVLNITASAGIASYPETCENPMDLLTRADWAMYTSKQNGRNQITIDSPQVRNVM